MMRYFIISFLLFITFSLSGQNLFMDYGTSSSSFLFKSSDGEKLEDILPVRNDFFTIGYEMLDTDFRPVLSIGHNQYGAQSSVDDFSWDVSYFAINIGGVYYLGLVDGRIDSEGNSYSLGSLKLLFNTNISHRFLTKGLQRIENNIYDLKEFGDGSFNNLWSLSLGTGLLYSVNNNVSINLKYSANRGMNNLEIEGQSLYIFAHHLSFGINIGIKRNTE